MNKKQIVIPTEDVEMLKILANPTRLQIVVSLMQHTSLNVTELIVILNLPQATVSQHLVKMRAIILGYDRKGLQMYYYIKNPKAPKIVEVLLSTI
ncbi:metalloregulator ArsR/SmtB family transcription factor [Bacillus thuringiensis]|uniref:ArsR/SmtB family transcription factor n=1 Tax=Bacillus thuringiensis TaxID=1428 RepID=UPI002DBB9639|nr:metalloregulator ArsR/SmtB family transcription factor [Bacillus thuringiensis]MEC3226083.1 metalloregulator ArsR/SmtB family transcription factor [Bacillus thuringiensis]MEC3462860.1 metalloregulator ArsR/SmtB family transcription factor [Bacillus thuringiensis]MEC3556026.1 metalloregulator ArsR/SmtB family transcription factor [Bacillus thuringiensis]MED2058849.1 metalloregulator ArsR/SmtB family transcription factor [Bacillus thuringiensis]